MGADKAARRRANERLQREIRRLHTEVDAHHDKGFQLGPVSCTRGCSACCRQIVISELREAEYILARRPEAVRRALPRLLEHARRAEGIPFDIDTPAGTAAAASAYWQLNQPCAFLDDAGRECTIYEDRPMPCRTHFVISDPALCASEARTAVWLADFGTRERAAELLFQEVGRTTGGALVVGALPQLMVEAIRRRHTWREAVQHALADRGDERADG